VSILPVNTRWPWVTPASFRPELVPEELMVNTMILSIKIEDPKSYAYSVLQAKSHLFASSVGTWINSNGGRIRPCHGTINIRRAIQCLHSLLQAFAGILAQCSILHTSHHSLLWSNGHPPFCSWNLLAHY